MLAEAGATAAVDVRGAAPATRETDVLDPVNLVQVAHGIVLSGGSAFGLDSASGVMRYLEEKKIGFEFGPAHVPIVPAAALFDLPVGDGLIKIVELDHLAAGPDDIVLLTSRPRRHRYRRSRPVGRCPD